MVTRAIHHLRAQIRVLQEQDSSDRCSSPGHHLYRRWRAPASPRAPQEAGEVPVPAQLSRTASRVLLRPRPLRARPRGPARSRSARHLDYTGRFERGLATVCTAREVPQDHQSGMEHYRRAGSVELPASSPIPQLPPDTLEMRVRDGSKIRNLLGLALGRLEGGSTRHVVFSGSGRAAGKAVSCAEIVKRRVPGLHQLTKLRFLQTEDSWVPTSPDTGLDPLTVRRHVPAVWVLLSRDPLDPSECGYQPPGAPPGLGSIPSSSCGPRPRRRARDTRS